MFDSETHNLFPSQRSSKNRIPVYHIRTKYSTLSDNRSFPSPSELRERKLNKEKKQWHSYCCQKDNAKEIMTCLRCSVLPSAIPLKFFPLKYSCISSQSDDANITGM